MDSLVKTLVDNSQKTLKNLNEGIVDNEEMINIVNEIKILFKEERYKYNCVEDLKKGYPDKTEK